MTTEQIDSGNNWDYPMGAGASAILRGAMEIIDLAEGKSIQ